MGIRALLLYTITWLLLLLTCLANCATGGIHVFERSKELCFRIPAIARTARGSLLAFAEVRHDPHCGDPSTREIGVRRSVDEGRTWSNMTFAAGNATSPIGNPYPIAMSSGRVALVFVRHDPRSKDYNYGVGNGVVFSDDDGMTWSAEYDVSAEFGRARGGLPGPGSGIELAGSGRLLVVSHRGAYKEDFITYSDDGGESWNTTGQSFPRMDEAVLADLGEGEVLLNMRHAAESKVGRAVARSMDGGMTWGKVTYDSGLPGPVCQGSMAAFGGHVYFSNPADRKARDQLTVRKSDDGGRTWPWEHVIQNARGGGYSSLVRGALGDGSGGHTFGGILFEDEYEDEGKGTIAFTTFPLDLLAWSPIEQKAMQVPEPLRAGSPLDLSSPQLLV